MSIETVKPVEQVGDKPTEEVVNTEWDELDEVQFAGDGQEEVAEAVEVVEEAEGVEEDLSQKILNQEEIEAYKNNPDYVTYPLMPGEYRAVKREDAMGIIESKLADVSKDPGMNDVNHLMNIIQAYRSGFSEEDKKRVAELKASNEYKIGMLRAEIAQKEAYLEKKKQDLYACNAEAQKILSLHKSFTQSEEGREEYNKAIDRVNYVREELSKTSNRLQKLKVELNDTLRKEEKASAAEAPVEEKPVEVAPVEVVDEKAEETEAEDEQNDGSTPAMIPFLQGSPESGKYFRDPDYLTVPKSSEQSYAIKKEDVPAVMHDLVMNGDKDDDNEIAMASRIANKVLASGSGFSEAEKKAVEAMLYTPEYQERLMQSYLHADEGRLASREKDLKEMIDAYEEIMKKDNNVVSRYLDRFNIDMAKERVKEAANDVELLKASIERRKGKKFQETDRSEIEDSKRKIISEIRTKEADVVVFEKELAKEEEELADLKRNNKNFIDKFMNRKKISESEAKVKQTKEKLEEARESLRRMNAELKKSNIELYRRDLRENVNAYMSGQSDEWVV